MNRAAQFPVSRRALNLAGLVGIGALAASGCSAEARRGQPASRRSAANADGKPAGHPSLTLSGPGPAYSGTFYSRARHRRVGYTIAYPPGHRPGSRLPLIVALHAFGGSHASVLGGIPTARGLALHVGGRPLPPMALAAADGGNLYWNRHPGDDPMAMLVHELIPMCQRLGLGSAPDGIGALGISMGGYGAILLAEKHPGLLSAVAAISPAIWTSYAQARSVNPAAYSSATAFRAADAVTHAGALHGVPLRIAAGLSDPFHPGVAALARVLPRDAIVRFLPGGHTRAFFRSQAPLALAFLGAHLG